MQNFRNVDAWVKAHTLVLHIYQEAAKSPTEETFGVPFQVKRSAVAVAARIAEGCGRESNMEFATDLRRAISSCSELEYLLLLARDLKLWSRELGDERIANAVEVRKMIYGLLRKL